MIAALPSRTVQAFQGVATVLHSHLRRDAGAVAGAHGAHAAGKCEGGALFDDCGALRRALALASAVEIAHAVV